MTLAFDFFSIGHSNIPAERFIALLRNAKVQAVADVRSTPLSRFCPWVSASNLKTLLANNGVDYLHYGASLGGRPRSPELYCDGVADYEAMARQPDFRTGLDRLIVDAAGCRAEGSVCVMCAERDPLNCHRCLLVARALAARGMTTGHILYDGAIEPHAATVERLLRLDGAESDLFATGAFSGKVDAGFPEKMRPNLPGLEERMAAAYRHRSRAVAYRAKRGATG